MGRPGWEDQVVWDLNSDQSNMFPFSFLFQTYLGIKTGQLLEAVMTRMRAILLITFGWAYGIILILICILFPRSEDPYKVGFKCERKAIPMTLVALSGLFIICSIITIQIQTLFILKSRLNEARGNDGRSALVTRISTGRIRLYKRAMGTSGMIGLVYVIGWMPLFVVYTINAWSLGDKDIVDTVLPKFVILAFILQSFSNAIIFRLRNLDKSCFTCCRKRNHVSVLVVEEASPRAGTRISTFQATPSQSPRAHASAASALQSSIQEDPTTRQRGMLELLEIPAPTYGTQAKTSKGGRPKGSRRGYQTHSSLMEDSGSGDSVQVESTVL